MTVALLLHWMPSDEMRNFGHRRHADATMALVCVQGRSLHNFLTEHLYEQYSYGKQKDAITTTTSYS